MIPEDRKYTREHEWVQVEDGVAVVGITDYAQRELGDVVFVNLPAVGTRVKQFERFGEVESVKAVSDLYAPVSGEVTEVNLRLSSEPELVNRSPYGDGWMIKIRLEDPDELNNLLSAEEYRQHIGEG
ncbi:MAG: glycine cleavage system protein H [Chloroflexota bacterium]